MTDFKKGDEVRHKLGGQAMEVVRVGRDGTVYVRPVNDEIGYNPKVLEKKRAPRKRA